MDLNPYQSPQAAGYDSPQPARVPLWQRVVTLVITGLALAYVGWVSIAVVWMAVDYARWQFGL